MKDKHFIYAVKMGLLSQCKEAYSVFLFCLNEDIAWKENRPLYQETAYQLALESIEKLLKMIIIGDFDVSLEEISSIFKKYNHNISNLTKDIPDIIKILNKKEIDILNQFSSKDIAFIKYGLIRPDIKDLKVSEAKKHYENYDQILELGDMCKKLIKEVEKRIELQ